MAANMGCDVEYVFMFWRKIVGGEKEGEKKRVSLSRPSSRSALAGKEE